MSAEPPDLSAEHRIDLEVKLAYQERLIRELDALVRTFADRLDRVEHELGGLRHAVGAAAAPIGPADEPPPHY